VRGLDDRAFEQLYNAHARALLSFFARRTLEIEVARDLWAETLASAFASRRRFRGRGEDQAAAWLYGIAHRQLALHHRRGRVERKALRRLGLEPPELLDGDIERIIEHAGLEALMARVDDELGLLDEGQREAVRLRVLEELSYEQVAARLNVTEDAARARVSRGLRRLASALALVRETP
jgi:RNA polymerase sigma-70 factor (ECF subfamily)